MKTFRTVVAAMRVVVVPAMLLLVLSLTVGTSTTAAQDLTTVIRAAKIIDGRGATIANGEIVVTGGKITKIGARGTAARFAKSLLIRHCGSARCRR